MRKTAIDFKQARIDELILLLLLLCAAIVCVTGMSGPKRGGGRVAGRERDDTDKCKRVVEVRVCVREKKRRQKKEQRTSRSRQNS